MPDKKMIKVCSIVLSALVAFTLLILFVTISQTEDISVTGTRSSSGFAAVENVTETELTQEDAPEVFKRNTYSHWAMPYRMTLALRSTLSTSM